MSDVQTQVHLSFEPIIDKQADILILGSLPGPESLASGEYYKYVGNSFWKIIFALHEKTPLSDYDEKCAFLLMNKIGLWDVFHSASREGAADAAIKNEIANDFVSFFATYPNLKGIIFNGGKAKKGFEKAYPDLFNKIPHETVWSTSGACAKTFTAKYENWKAAIDRLRKQKQV